MGKIRPLSEADLPQVLTLHNRVFGNWASAPPAETLAYFTGVFLDHPWPDHTVSSLIYEGDDGRVAGCLGVMSRPMIWKDRPIHAAVSHTFMVDPASRSSLAGIQLMKTFFDGPQDLSLCEGNDLSRRVWMGLGGATVPAYRFLWTCPLRPAEHVRCMLADHGVCPPLTATLAPLGRIADALVLRLPKSPFRGRRPRLVGKELETTTFLARLPDVTRSWALRPEYDERSWSWLLDFLGRRTRLGTLRKMCVQDPARASGDGIVGWYVYYARPGGLGQVLQVAAQDEWRDDVLDHLFHDALEHGVVALSGQVEPRLLEALAARSRLFRPCLFRLSGSHVLIHSRLHTLTEAIQSGQAFLSRLEGEWWIRG